MGFISPKPLIHENEYKVIQVFLMLKIIIHKEWCQVIRNQLSRLSHKDGWPKLGPS